MLLVVLFQGKGMEKCPKGYTICNKLESLTGRPNNTCIKTDDCQSRIAEAEKAKAEGNDKDSDLVREEGLREKEEEKKEEAKKQNIEEVNDLLNMIKRGVIVDPSTDQMIGNIDFNNLESTVDFFKSLSRLYSNETLQSTDLGKELSTFLNILTSPKLEGRPEIANGLAKDFLGNVFGITG